MRNRKLLERVAKLGFNLFEAEEEQNANLTLADMVKSGDRRLWEGFPIVLVNSAEKGLFNYEKVIGYLKNVSQRKYLDSLMMMSLALYKFFNLKFLWADRLYKSLSKEKKEKVEDFLKKLENDEELVVAGFKISSQRLKMVFNNYFKQFQSKTEELLSLKEELGLEFALSQIFSSKQKEILLKKLKGERLTKTEREYFSRVIKKKVLALANVELHQLCRKLLEK
jgi:hypothetical protein